MVLDDCAKFYLEHNWWFYFNSTNSIKHTSRKKIAFFCFFFALIDIFLTFSYIHATINREGSVSKTSNTWWKYWYLPPTCNNRINTWYRYRTHPYQSLSWWKTKNMKNVARLYIYSFHYRLLRKLKNNCPFKQGNSNSQMAFCKHKSLYCITPDWQATKRIKYSFIYNYLDYP